MMTPIEKAKDLYAAALEAFGKTDATCYEIAIFCVDEIIKANPIVNCSNPNYWKQVKEELQKM